MNKRIEPDSWIWLVAMALTGTGCTFMGPFLPTLSGTWHLHDRQAGLLLSCVFLGSFSGTMVLARDLGRTLRMGAVTSFLGLLLFAWLAGRANGFSAGMWTLFILGFGLGQLMTSINLLVGSAEVTKRSRCLANVGAAWCFGAVLSPVLTAGLLARLSPSLRLSLFAPVYLLPILMTRGRSMPAHGYERVVLSAVAQVWKRATLWVVVFLVYGGIEASVGGWMPVFALRYQLGTLGQAQWILSIFWGGLITGRALVSVMVTPSREAAGLRLAIALSACSMLWMVVAPSPLALLCGIALTGVSLGPIFPLLLASAIESRLSSRSMGVVLASCGLGSAIFLSLLGTISSAVSLRAAMALPVCALVTLSLLRRQKTMQSSEIADLRM